MCALLKLTTLYFVILLVFTGLRFTNALTLSASFRDCNEHGSQRVIAQEPLINPKAARKSMQLQEILRSLPADLLHEMKPNRVIYYIIYYIIFKLSELASNLL